MGRFECRFTMLMVSAVWVHLTHDIIWLALGVPVAACAWVLYTIHHEDKEQRAAQSAE